MPKGPQLNNIQKNFTTRDSLGIESVATSMQAEVCPVVNTVTPRAFYWPFMIWIYYDFYKYSGISEHTVAAFDGYLKRQDYFFVLAALLTNGSDQNFLVGITQSQIDINNNPDGPYLYNKSYFKTRYGGMQYYNAGCLSMYFITDTDPNNNKELSFPALRPEGEEMAKAFETVIKDTEYYKSYRRNDDAVPKRVLEEYGKAINLGLKGFDKCKEMLRHYMFEDDRAVQLKARSEQLSECARYISLIVRENGINELNASVCRAIFYYRVLPSGATLHIPDDCVDVANKWEIIVGRMYFTSGLGMFWKYMLEQLNEPLTLKKWIELTIEQSDFNWDLKKPLSSIVNKCVYDFNSMESMIAATAKRNTSPYSIENGLKIILSVYDRFHKRTDLDAENYFFDWGIDNHSIPISELFEQVDAFMDRTIKDFVVTVMQHWIIEQHYLTAFDKMLQGRDGFYYEIIDDKYVRRHNFVLDFQGIRMIQLAQVMRDLDML